MSSKPLTATWSVRDTNIMTVFPYKAKLRSEIKQPKKLYASYKDSLRHMGLIGSSSVRTCYGFEGFMSALTQYAEGSDNCLVRELMAPSTWNTCESKNHNTEIRLVTTFSCNVCPYSRNYQMNGILSLRKWLRYPLSSQHLGFIAVLCSALKEDSTTFFIKMPQTLGIPICLNRQPQAFREIWPTSEGCVQADTHVDEGTYTFLRTGEDNLWNTFSVQFSPPQEQPSFTHPTYSAKKSLLL